MTRVNRVLIAHALNIGEPLARYTNRAVGKTTEAILRALADSYAKPGTWVRVDDPDCNSHMIARHLEQQIRSTLCTLRLDKIEVSLDHGPGRRDGPCSPSYRPNTPGVYVRNTFCETL